MIDYDRPEAHLLTVALDERIRDRIKYRKWYRETRGVLRRPAWRIEEALNAAVLTELLAIRRTVKRAAAKVPDGITEAENRAIFGDR